MLIKKWDVFEIISCEIGGILNFKIVYQVGE